MLCADYYVVQMCRVEYYEFVAQYCFMIHICPVAIILGVLSLEMGVHSLYPPTNMDGFPMVGLVNLGLRDVRRDTAAEANLWIKSTDGGNHGD